MARSGGRKRCILLLQMSTKAVEAKEESMKTLPLIGLGLCLIFAVIPVPAQDDVGPSRYDRCATSIRNTPQDAYELCKQYLEQTPAEDAKKVECIRQWIANYEKVLPYIQFLQALTTDERAAWLVYEPDMDIKLPQTSEKEGPYAIEILRSFGDANEESMLMKAEAVYSSPSKMVGEVLRSLDDWTNESPNQMAPLWGMRGNDEIQSTEVVTARAVRYYYDLTLAVRQNPHLPSGFEALQTNLKYVAGIKHFDHYSHNKDRFENVYVADLTLVWGFGCGGLCGMGFTRNKLVVLDSKGDVVAMYLDAPANSESWVS
jgi:hypothetical protein